VLQPLIEEAYASWTPAPAVNSGDTGLGQLDRVIGSGIDEETTM